MSPRDSTLKIDYNEFILNYDQSLLPLHKTKSYTPPQLVEVGRLINVVGDEAWRDNHGGRHGDFCRVISMNDTFYVFVTDHPPGPANYYYVRGFDQNWQFTGFEKRLTPDDDSDVDQDIAFDGEYIYQYAMLSRAGKIRKFDKEFNLVKQSQVFSAIGNDETILDINIEVYNGKIYAGSEYRENNDLWEYFWKQQGGNQNLPPNTEVARATHLRIFDNDLNLIEERNLVANISGAAIPNQYWAIGASQFYADGYHCVAAVSPIANITYFNIGESIGARQLFILRFDEDFNFVDSNGPLSDTSTSNSWCTGSLYEDERYYIVYCTRRSGEGHQYGPGGPRPGRRQEPGGPRPGPQQRFQGPRLGPRQEPGEPPSGAPPRGLSGMGHIMLGIFDEDFNELETVVLTSGGGSRPQLLKMGNKLYVTYDTTRGEAFVQELILKD